MRKKIVRITIILILLLSIFTACSKSDSPTKNDIDAGAAKSDYYGMENEEGQEAQKQAEAPMDDDVAITGSGTGETSTLNAVLAERKVIRNAYVTIEVEKFDEAYSRISSLLTGIGFIQESNINTEKIYVDNEQRLLKNGVIIIRVDKDKFDKVFNDIKGLGITTSERMGIEDVTSKYLDVESRLRLVRYEEGRLEEYLKKLDDPDKIFKTQSRLTEIRHEIESLTVTLKKLDDLIELSTITINMNEIRPGDKNLPAKKTYGERLLSNFLNSFEGVIKFFGEVIIIVFQLLPILVVMGFFLFIALMIYRKTIKKSKNIYPENNYKNENSENNDKE